jgi:serine/threonine protein kinase
MIIVNKKEQREFEELKNDKMNVDSDQGLECSKKQEKIKINTKSHENSDDSDSEYEYKGMNQKLDSFLRVQKLIGQGASAKIYLCSNRKNTNQKMVAKFIFKKSKLLKKLDQKKFKKFVNNEILIQINCRHKHIIAGLGYFQLGEDAFTIIQELASKGNLVDFLQDIKRKVNTPINMKKKDKLFSESIICYIANDLISAFKYLNAVSVVHQDIKAENVVVNSKYELKITDFSVSVKHVFNDLFHIYSRNGTSTYMAPENIGCKLVPVKESFKSDYYSLGVIL